MKATIVSIGTELTDGQIINRNAAWLSEKLKFFGLRTAFHLTVPDERKIIFDSLDQALESSDFVFVTGGLGPTSDDFTRDVVSTWIQKPLIFDEPSWKNLCELLISRGYPVQEFQKQQCFFPEGCVILHNSQGTANAFRLSHKQKHIVILPGPPREISAIWNDHLSTWLTELNLRLDPVITKSWDVLGLGESQVAALVEPYLQGVNMEVGYRVHLPYVEFKLSCPKSHLNTHSKLLQKIEDLIGSYTVTRDGEDIVLVFSEQLKKLPSTRVEFYDEACDTFLFQRLQTVFKDGLQNKSWSFSKNKAASNTFHSLIFSVDKLDENRVQVSMDVQNQQQSKKLVLDAPMKAANMSDRRKQYFAELAIVTWSGWLESMRSQD
jgi:nicotinamide-nucleotide amidase